MKNTFVYNNYLEAQKVLSTLEKELEQHYANKEDLFFRDTNIEAAAELLERAKASNYKFDNNKVNGNFLAMQPGQREIRIDEKGHFTNVYAQSGGETYKVLNAKVEEHYSYLEVETLNGDKQRLSMTTNWNWRMTTEKAAYNSLPNVYTVEDDKGSLTKEPVTFPKFVFDSSD